MLAQLINGHRIRKEINIVINFTVRNGSLICPENGISYTGWLKKVSCYHSTTAYLFRATLYIVAMPSGAVKALSLLCLKFIVL